MQLVLSYYGYQIDLKKPVEEVLFYDIKKGKTQQNTQTKLKNNNYSYNYYDKSKNNVNYSNKKYSIINKFDLSEQPENQDYQQMSFQNSNYNSYGNNYKNYNNPKQGSFKVPLNKDYNFALDIEDNRKVESKKLITEKYQYLDFAKIFFNLNLLYKTDKPVALEGKLISEVIRDLPRKELDIHKKKAKQQGRERAQTFFESRRSNFKH